MKRGGGEEREGRGERKGERRERKIYLEYSKTKILGRSLGLIFCPC